MAVLLQWPLTVDDIWSSWQGPDGKIRARQVCFIQQGFGHYVEQLGSEPTKLIVLFNSPIYEAISISKWLSANPASLIADNFGISDTEVARLPKKVLGFIK